MEQAATYSATDTLRDGRAVQVRALRREDESELLQDFEQGSTESLHRRFFAVKRHFSEEEKDFLFHADFITNVVLLAIIDEGARQVIAGGVRYVLTAPRAAELAFSVLDRYHGQGIGSVLMRHIVALARQAGLKTLTAEVLPENLAMLKILQRSGLFVSTSNDPQVVHLTLKLS